MTDLEAEHARLAAQAQDLAADWLDAHVAERTAAKLKVEEALRENNQARKRVEKKIRRCQKADSRT